MTVGLVCSGATFLKKSRFLKALILLIDIKINYINIIAKLYLASVESLTLVACALYPYLVGSIGDLSTLIMSTQVVILIGLHLL